MLHTLPIFHLHRIWDISSKTHKEHFHLMISARTTIGRCVADGYSLLTYLSILSYILHNKLGQMQKNKEKLVCSIQLQYFQ